ncbi:AmpG family muropeptide MFS transporter [Kushneria phosphatilytica]|uniref:AmpG family muropeptide MFS transporter n=1 Tax=Kushneria phosphatilytica TaxID=657387 RepID=A0A1S1NZN7_9GAMM|nr:AmpG family muropeptide MFS transporter [Kushneria phosphatilytica]OHV12343.1 AmpG family muropeptide MFS transporter [Kushneria phosphatilytica]QEL11006.1 AmpG family muropeptide MFS transporter [Kushneria phosphatilytica]
MMGLASGLPLLLTGSVMQAWMTDAGVSLDAVGLLALVGIPYTLKFLWAPLLDRLPPPIMGRRRGWLTMIQLALALLIISLSMLDPGQLPLAVGVMALLVSLFSASQDIVIDAYRREHLPERELGLGSSFYVYGYRIGTLIASGGGLMLADQVGFQTTYLIMGLILGGCILITLLAPEPEAVAPGTPLRWRNTFLDPINNFLNRPGAWWILLFILLYKLGDSVATNLTIPFYKEIGFSNTEIGTTVKLFGVWMIMAGTMLGGALILRLGIYRSLWWFGLLQMISTAGFIWLNHVGHSLAALATVVSFENLAAGMGTAAFIAFMAALTDVRFTAGQYALLSSIMGLPRVVIASPSGILASAVGWDLFFLICTLAALPGLVMLWRFREWRDQLEVRKQQPVESID